MQGRGATSDLKPEEGRRFRYEFTKKINQNFKLMNCSTDEW